MGTEKAGKNLTYPAYLTLAQSGELAERAHAAVAVLASCTLCPRECRVNRLREEQGYCRVGRQALVASYGPHFGEEAPLVGFGGSGTVFFSGCNLRCIFCQNSDISLKVKGRMVTAEELAAIMLHLQRQACHNINLVTPTHVLPQILEALVLAANEGLRLPLVWNCGGYESIEALRLLNSIVDIYMPDIKYGDAAPAAEFSNAPDYPERAEAAVREMHRQVGDLKVDRGGIARRGLLVRHLVMPGGVAGSEKVLRLLADLSRNTYVNVMSQYRPCAEAVGHPVIGRRLEFREYRAALKAAEDAGLSRLDKANREL